MKIQDINNKYFGNELGVRYLQPSIAVVRNLIIDQAIIGLFYDIIVSRHKCFKDKKDVHGVCPNCATLSRLFECLDDSLVVKTRLIFEIKASYSNGIGACFLQDILNLPSDAINGIIQLQDMIRSDSPKISLLYKKAIASYQRINFHQPSDGIVSKDISNEGMLARVNYNGANGKDIYEMIEIISKLINFYKNITGTHNNMLNIYSITKQIDAYELLFNIKLQQKDRDEFLAKLSNKFQETNNLLSPFHNIEKAVNDEPL
jgi:hypothetical protein